MINEQNLNHINKQNNESEMKDSDDILQINIQKNTRSVGNETNFDPE